MDSKTKGSWLVHHTNKLQGVTNQTGFEKTFVAGKAGILLSAISQDDSITISKEKLDVLAANANINTLLELPGLINVLKQQELIDTSANGIAVLGVTSSTTLQHTSSIFTSLDPTPTELASLELAESVSVSPQFEQDISEELADTFKLSSIETDNLFSNAEKVGFVDADKIGDKRLLFNGNLFRREDTKKIKAVLDSLNSTEQSKLNEISERLRKQACLSVDFAENFLGEQLFQKLSAIGFFDINVVSNSTENVGFLTLPSAFSKFSNAMVDDAFDLAKAFVSSITYGMTKSAYERGQIQAVDALISALVRGERVGPVKAIAEDYKVLELKGVVEVREGVKKGRRGPMLKLLKKEIGELALQVIRQGDISEHSLTALPTAAVTKFNGPEYNREKVRRKQTVINPKATNDMLSILRTGGKL